MTRYRKSWTEVIKEVYLGEALKPADKKVVDSFYDKEVNDNGKILSTNGVDLFKMGIGGQPIATWKKGKIQIVAKMDVKSTESIIKYMKADKKNNSSKINLILIKKIGKIILESKFNEPKIRKFISKELIY